MRGVQGRVAQAGGRAEGVQSSATCQNTRTPFRATEHAGNVLVKEKILGFHIKMTNYCQLFSLKNVYRYS